MHAMKNTLKLLAALVLLVTFVALPVRSVAAATFQLSGRVTNQSSAAIIGATVTALDATTSAAVASATTGSTGSYTLSVAAGTYDFRVTPPSGSAFQISTVPNRTISANTMLDFTLVPTGAVTLSGRMLDGEGNGVPNVNLNLYPASGGGGAAVLTDATGSYSFAVAPGNYYLRIYYSQSTTAAVGEYIDLYTASFELTQNRVLDLPLPFQRVTVQVQDSTGNPVSDVQVQSSYINPGSGLSIGQVPLNFGNTGDGATTNGAGTATLWLLPTAQGATAGNLYTLTVRPPSDSSYPVATRSGVAVTTGTNVISITLPNPVTLNGRMLDGEGNGVPNVNLNLYPASGGGGAAVLTDATGSYSFAVAPGNYYLRIYYSQSTTAAVGEYIDLYTASFELTQNRVLDLPLPFQRVTVQVQDSTGNPVSDVQVQSSYINPGSGLSIGQVPLNFGNTGDGATTNGAGTATLWLLPTAQGATAGNLYTLTVRPPSDSSYPVATRSGVAVTTGTNVISITLPNPVTLNGRMLDGEGNGVPNVNLNLYPASGGGGAAVLTDATGSYSFAVAPGNYYLRIYYSQSTTAAVGEYIDLYTASFELTQNRVLDLPLPFQRVTVQVQDSTGNPVSDVQVQSSYINPGSGLSIGQVPLNFGNTGDGATTNGAGTATLWLLPTAQGATAGNLYTLTVRPPSDSSYPVATRSGVAVTTGTNVISITLPNPVTLNGRMLDGEGNGVPNVNLNLYPASGGGGAAVLTDATGSYSFAVAPGNYYLRIYYSQSTTAAVGEYIDLYTASFELTQNRVLDLPLPFQRVTVQVQDSTGNPVSDVQVQSSYINPGSGLSIGQVPLNFGNTGDGATTNGAGTATLWLLPTAQGATAGNLYTLTVRPPSDSSYPVATRSGVAVTTGTNVISITLPNPVTLNGRMLDGEGNGVPNVNLNLYPASGGGGAAVLTDATGSYSFAVAPGNYYLRIYYSQSTTAAVGEYIDLYTASFELTQNRVLDLPLPFQRVTVQVQDSTGNPVSDVQVQSSYINPGSGLSIGQVPLNFGNTGDGATTNGAGTATLWLLPTAQGATAGNLYTLTVRPPTSSPFVTFTQNSMAVSGPRDLIIILQFIHAPPVTTAATSPSPDASGVYPGPVTVTLSATAASGFLIANTHYTADGGPTQTYTAPFVVSGGGSHTIRYWSVDNIGVIETPKSLTIQIQSIPPLVIVTDSPLPGGTVGQTYSVILHAAGGTPPYTWSVVTGALPPGLTLNPTTGEISGVPTAAGTFGFTIQVRDSSSQTSTKPFGLAPPPPSGSAGSEYTVPVHIDPSPSGGGSVSCTNYTV